MAIKYNVCLLPFSLLLCAQLLTHNFLSLISFSVYNLLILILSFSRLFGFGFFRFITCIGNGDGPSFLWPHYCFVRFIACETICWFRDYWWRWWRHRCWWIFAWVVTFHWAVTAVAATATSATAANSSPVMPCISIIVAGAASYRFGWQSYWTCRCMTSGHHRGCGCGWYCRWFWSQRNANIAYLQHFTM